jgi:hypothetical protein
VRAVRGGSRGRWFSADGDSGDAIEVRFSKGGGSGVEGGAVGDR